MADEPILITFVCWGNICRSPAARMVMERMVADAGLAESVVVDSSGTGSWHTGDGADRGTVREGQRRGYDTKHSAKQFRSSDFEVFDYVIALDSDRADDLRAMATSDGARAKVMLLRSFDANADDLDVPDPYGYGEDMFVLIFDQIETACAGLLDYLCDTHNL